MMCHPPPKGGEGTEHRAELYLEVVGLAKAFPVHLAHARWGEERQKNGG